MMRILKVKLYSQKINVKDYDEKTFDMDHVGYYKCSLL